MNSLRLKLTVAIEFNQALNFVKVKPITVLFLAYYGSIKNVPLLLSLLAKEFN